MSNTTNYSDAIIQKIVKGIVKDLWDSAPQLSRNIYVLNPAAYISNTLSIEYVCLQ